MFKQFAYVLVLIQILQLIDYNLLSVLKHFYFSWRRKIFGKSRKGFFVFSLFGGLGVKKTILKCRENKI